MARETVKYKNPWHKRNDPHSGPEYYSVDIYSESNHNKPVSYKGCMIYVRWDRFGEVWDIVKDGVCVGQRAGPNGAKARVDELINN